MAANNLGIKEKFRIWELSNGCCFYCGVILEFDRVTLDHIIARIEGGNNRQSNLVISCRRCNYKKGRYPLGSAFRTKKDLEEAVRIYLNLTKLELFVLKLLRKLNKKAYYS